MTTLRTALLALIVLGLPGAAMAADEKIEVGDDVFHLHTNSTGGDCRTREVAGGTIEVVCQDDDTVVAMDTMRGCLDSRGSGYCVKNEPHESGVSANQLNCPNGKSYYLHTGRWSDNTCRRHEEGKLCTSENGSDTAEARCDTGCTKASGAGICCIAAKGHCTNARITKPAQGADNDG